MRLLQEYLIVLLLCITGALSDFLGPVWPAPRDISSRASRVAIAWKNLTSTLETSLYGHENKTSPTLQALRNLTFSAGMFSIHDPGAETLQFHYAAPEIAKSSIGTKKVDADSIYRVASISKLITGLAAMIELDIDDWERPISKIFPPLAEFLREKTGTLDPVYDVQWDQVTSSAMAGHMAGISTFGAPWYTDLVLYHSLSPEPVYDPATYGLPPVDLSDPAIWPPCLNGDVNCTAGPYTEGIASTPPVFLPWTSPVYSNNGYTLLGMAIANLTGTSIHQVYQDAIFSPLGMDSTYSRVPPESEIPRCVVAGNFSTGFGLDNGLSVSSGGIFSTTNDLAKFGLGILKSLLLTPEKTRRWMKPITHTADLHYSMGKPWEIYRYQHPKTGVVTDFYTKLGDSGNYGGVVALFPDFDIGFSVLEASSMASRSELALLLMDLITESILPALMDQAALEAERNFVGTYISTTEGLNSSISFGAAKDSAPGLEVTSWVSNGTDLMPLVPLMMRSKNYALRPTISNVGETGQIAFRPFTVTEHPVNDRQTPQMLFSKLYDVGDWAFFDGSTYGGINLPLFVFDVDQEDGDASAVSPAAWRVKLEKVRK